MFSDKLKLLRSQKGLTQVQLSQELNISSGTVAMWETGKRIPDSETLVKLADFFNCSVDYLLGRTSQCEVYTLCDIDRVAKAMRGRLEEETAEPMTDSAQLIISRIKDLRESLGYSYQDLATLTGLSKSTLQRYETGSIMSIPLNKIEVLASALHTSPEYILGRGDRPHDIDVEPVSFPLFPERLRRERAKKKLTQQEVSEVLELAISTYSGYETGRREPDLFTLVRITEVLGCTPNDLLLPGKAEERQGFLERLTKMMRENIMNVSALSKQTGIPYTTIDGWYKRDCDRVSFDTLIVLADFFGCSVDYLIGRSDIING